MLQQCSHVDISVIVRLQHVASSVTISTDPRQSRHRLHRQVPIGVLEVHLDVIIIYRYINYTLGKQIMINESIKQSISIFKVV